MKQFFALFVLVLSCDLKAMSVDWGGTYRFEYIQIDKPTLNNDNKGAKAYFLNHLNLGPKLIVSDGINVVSNFEVFENDTHPNSQLGMAFGSGFNNNTGSGVNDPSSSATQRQQSGQIKVNQLYVNVLNEYGAFVAGRVPVQFGLGMTHNAGAGLWDHWGDTHDLVGYKIIIGNFFMMPMMGKPHRDPTALSSGASEMIWHLEYNNPETESAIGVFYQTTSAGMSDNDAYKFFGVASNNVTGSWGVQSTNVFFSRGWDGFKFKMEAGFLSGGTGISNTGEEIKMNGYGLAMDLDFSKPDNKWNFYLKMGVASGDNPNTKNFEGFHFDRNYDVAFLLFNHPMGTDSATRDTLTSKLQRDRNRTCTVYPCSPYTVDKTMDDEVLGNAVYISPKLDYRISDKLDLTNTITWAQIQTNPALDPNNGVAKDLGVEWDIGIVYKPHEKVRWLTELGIFSPGAAWQNGTENLQNSLNFGVQTKAAISF